MEGFVITGSSSGLGKALAEYALDNTNAPVIGISRKCTIEHDRYTHLSIDLTDNEAVQSFDWPAVEGVSNWVLINNAGSLGPVMPLAQIKGEDYARLLQLNVVSPTLLMGKCLTATQGKGRVINISSGAGKYPIMGWAAYGSSKAALDLASEIAAAENPEAYIRAVSPGIIDTPMQAEIRGSSADDFPGVQQFKDYKEYGDLATPSEVASKIFYILDHPEVAPGTLFSVRDL